MKKLKWLLCLIFIFIRAANSADLELKTKKIGKKVSLDPFDSIWNKVKSVEIPLMPQVIAPPGGGGSVAKIWIKALQNKNEIFFRLEWEDPTLNENPTAAESFTDAVALEFPENSGSWPSPFMGDLENPILIWRWSASAQKDLDQGFQSGEITHPNKTADIYPFDGEITFRAGENAGNIISKRKRETPIETLAAKGFGTLTILDDSSVKGKGVWRNERWHVVLEKKLDEPIKHWLESEIPFAVAVWDGQNQERDGIKSFSIWYRLVLDGKNPKNKSSQVSKGEMVYLRYGCGTCHGKGALGGIHNPNSQLDPIPSLNQVKETFTQEELQKVIFNGREPEKADPRAGPPPFKMNGWGSVMSQEEVHDLMEYLFSLQTSVEEWK
ncbi:MAG: c-type cytochrome [Elusimicrobia bacterium]|nr:c-type cytochrome [Elusimicrobiota bacterium]